MSGHWSVVDGAAILGTERYARYEGLIRRGREGIDLTPDEREELRMLSEEMDAKVFAEMRQRAEARRRGGT